MVKYLFKLKKAYVPDLTRITEQDKLYGGTRLVYVVKKIFFLKLFGFDIPYYIKRCGKVTFLRPYKKYWDKRKHRLPVVYWGKKSHPLTRLWVIVDNTLPLGATKIVPQASLIHQKVKIFNRVFNSKQITAYLFSRCRKFYIYKQLI